MFSTLHTWVNHMYFGLLIVGLVVGFGLRAARPNAHINPGKIAVGVVTLPAMLLTFVQGIGAAGDPEQLGFVIGYSVGAAFIPIVIAAMVWYFMRD